MSTLKQQEANRLNAQKSTGPRTDAGKAASRFNALKSGIDSVAETIPGEDPVKLEALLAEYRAHHDTSTPERRMLVDTLVNCEWMLRRLRRGEVHFWLYRDENACGRTDYPEGRLIAFGDSVYDRIQRRINSIQRNYLRALKELETLPEAAVDADQPAEAPAPPPQPVQPPSNQSIRIPNGFVPRFRPSAPQQPPADPLSRLPQPQQIPQS